MAQGVAVVIAWLLGSRIGQYVLAGLVFVAAVFGIRHKWTGDGRQQARDESNRQTLDNVRKANEADNAVAGADAAERVRLKRKWTRE
jgi:hypothetical protein